MRPHIHAKYTRTLLYVNIHMESLGHCCREYHPAMLETRIREARTQRGWSQADLARRMNVAQPTVSGWEAGRKAPRTNLMARLARILGVSFEWLTTGRGEMAGGTTVLVARDGKASAYLPEMEADEQQLLMCYARLKPAQRKALLGFLQSLKR